MRTPTVVKWASALTFLNTFVLFEEFVVDRHGLWKYMPLYKVGRFCTWDIAAIALAVGLVLLWQYRDKRAVKREGI